ncbi:MAG: hypothetical protein QOE11_2519 [Solirubrobacteraceae bacterium]|nr:hypothetical protein [Solirubrobacteraceae bacterium]
MLLAVALLLATPLGAQARTPCAAELSAPTAAAAAQVSDAIFCLTNQIRASYGLAPFRRDARLDTAARLHSEDMAARNYFAHVTPEGLSPGDRASAQGYVPGVGENIASGYATASAVIIGWMGSTGHCQNILGVARDIGVGTAPSARGGYYTQDFGDYAFGTEGPVPAACPYTIDLDALVTAAPLSPVVAGPATATAPTPPPPDTTPRVAGPVLGPLGLSSSMLRPGARRSVVSYTLSEQATVRFRVERRLHARWTTLTGSLTDEGRQGANSFVFTGRLRGRRLAPGRYRLRADATDDAGNASAPRRASFRVARR